LIPRPAAAQIAASGRTLTVTTANAVATFTGADVVGFVNRLTGESYLRKPSSGELAFVNAMSSTGQSLQTSNWVLGTEAGTGLPLATIEVKDTVRVLTLSVRIDPASQEIVLRSSATVSTKGLRAASWSIAGLDLDGGRWIVPAMTGLVFDKAHPGLNMYLEYPNTWHAQMAVYEAAVGSFVLYSTDPQFCFKQLHHTTRGDSTIDVAVATNAFGPMPDATGTPPVEWRFKAVAGDWRAAAAIYRTWLNANRPPLPDTAHAWVSNIRTVVGIHNLDVSSLAPLAALLVPSQTLLYVVDWRQTGYDVNYPDYTPHANAAAFVNAAKALGFRVMLHIDLIGVSTGNPDYPALQKYQVLTPDNLQPTGWQWDQPSSPTRFAYISPAADAFRAKLIMRVTSAVTALAPDALHLDISEPMFNDGRGLVDGRTYAQGSIQLHDDLLAAFPGLAFGGEAENDILYRYHPFAQALFYPLTLDVPGHPIATFLFSPKVQYYGHLGQPAATAPGFGSYLIKLERRAILPRLVLGSPADLDMTNADNARLIHLLQSWQAHAFQPAWSADWTGVRAKYQGLAGASASYVESPTVSSLTAAGTTLFQTAHDANQVTASSFVPSWPAFDGTRLYGLDPARSYFLDPVPRPVATHVTSLPEGVKLGLGTLVSPAFAHVEIQPVVAPPFDFEQHLIDAHPGVRYQGADTPMGNGALAASSWGTVSGDTRFGITLQPPFSGQIGGSAFLHYDVPVPAEAIMRFSVGVADGGGCTDGVTFRVTANEFELWSQHVQPGAWQDIVLDLAPYGGKTTALRLISDPGPAGQPWCDWALWANAAVSAPSPAGAISVPLALAPGSVTPTFKDGDGTLSATGLSATVTGVPLQGAFTIFTQPGATVGDGTNLAGIPFSVWSAAQSGIARPGPIFNSGSVGSVSAGGVLKNQTIFAHPPDAGRTVLAWAVRLPSTTLRLGFSVGIGDGGASADGIDFQVKVNGTRYWQLTKQSNAWQPGALDLSRWARQDVLIELVTDSRENFYSDWAYWADLVLTTSAGGCEALLPAAIAVPAFGGTFSANVTAPAACPWSATTGVPWLSMTAGSGNGNGTVSFAVAANPGAARSGTVSVGSRSLNVTQAASPVVTNALPTLSAIANVGSRRNTPLTLAVSVGDPVGGAAGVVLSATSSNAALLPNANIAAGGSGANRTLTIVPATNRTGTATVVVTARARGYIVTTAFRLTIHGSGPATDFDADNRSEIGVYRPSTGAWYLLKSASAFTAGAGYAWGAPGDLPQLGDFDGDGKADITVYRPASAYWFILESTTNYTAWDTYQWGTTGDIPVAADYDGDGRTDVAVYRPGSGTWYILLSATGFTGGAVYTWGALGDVALPGDYDGDGRADLAVYRPSSGHWFILQSTTGYSSWGTYQWGSTGDVMVPADYDGDGRTDLAVYRPSTGSWYVLTSSSQFTAGAGYAWGAPGDVPVPEDYDGDGQTDIAVYRPSTAHWFVRTSTSGYTTSLTYQWGSTGDVPLPRRQ
jgi:hypothetical protein